MTATGTGPDVIVRRAAQRARTDIGWLDSWHSFNFNQHYSADDTHFGVLVVSNDDVVAAGGGFGEHPHRDMEIVTWVLDGELEHRDTTGTHGTIRPGIAQRMTAGRGIRHSEMNARDDAAVHFVQMWVVPDAAGLEPGYQQADVSAALDAGELVAVASGDASRNAAIHIHQAHATMWAARPPHGQCLTLPTAPFLHVFVATGAATLTAADASTHDLHAGDAARCVDLTEAPSAATLTAESDDCEVIIWEMTATLR